MESWDSNSEDLLWEKLKNEPMLFQHGTSRLAGQALAGTGWPVFISGDSDSEIQNLSTQLTQFPLAGHYHVSPTLLNSHGLLWCTSGNPTLCSLTFLSGTQLSRHVKENTTQT